MEHSNRDFPTEPNGYDWYEYLGEGAISKVYRVIVKHGPHKGQSYAIKSISLDKVSGIKLESIMKGIIGMHSLNHPSLIDFPFNFIHQNILYLGMEYMAGGSIRAQLDNRYPSGIKDVSVLTGVLRPALASIYYLHSNKHIHRDVKASNILLSEIGEVKLADIGLSAKLKKGKKHETLVGSPCWMAPEILECEGNGYDEKIDIWAFGITIIELVTGSPPYHGTTFMSAIMAIIESDPPTLEGVEGVHPEIARLVQVCLQKDPALRPSALELKENFKSLWGKAKNHKQLCKYFAPILSNQSYTNNSTGTLETKKDAIIWDFSGLGEDEEKLPAM